MLEKLGAVLQKRGNYTVSSKNLVQALKIRRMSEHDIKHEEILHLLSSLARVNKESGEYATALQHIDSILKYEDISASQSSLFEITLLKSEIHVLREEYSLAMDAATNALDLANLQGLDYNERLLSRATATDQIAKVLEAQRNFDDAMLWHKRAYSVRCSILSEKHELTSSSAKNIARIFRKQGEFDKAKTLFKEIRDKLIDVYGVEHPSVADLLDDLGNVYTEQKTFATALRCHEKALEIRRRCQQDGGHPDAGVTMTKIGALLLRKDRFRAMKFFSEALDVFRRNHFCQRHPLVLATIRDMTAFDHGEDALESKFILR